MTDPTPSSWKRLADLSNACGRKVADIYGAVAKVLVLTTVILGFVVAYQVLDLVRAGRISPERISFDPSQGLNVHLKSGPQPSSTEEAVAKSEPVQLKADDSHLVTTWNKGGADKELAKPPAPQPPAAVLVSPPPENPGPVVRGGPVDLVLVFDRSYAPSMENNPGLFQEMKEGAKSFLAGLNDQSRVSLLALNNSRIWSAKDLSLGSSREFLQRKIDGLFADGGCALSEGLLDAAGLLQERKENTPAVVVVVTTAQSNKAGPAALSALAGRVTAQDRRPVRVHVLAFGLGQGQEVAGALREFATLTGGSFQQGDGPDSARNMALLLHRVSERAVAVPSGPHVAESR